MSKYASKTTVTVEKSVAEIQRILTRWGADGFGYFTQGNKAMVQFSKNDKVIKFVLKMPDRDSDEIALTHYGYDRSAAAAEKACTDMDETQAPRRILGSSGRARPAL